MEALINRKTHGSISSDLIHRVRTSITQYIASNLVQSFAKVKVCVDGALWMTAEINAAYVPFYDAVDAVKDVPNSNSGK